MTRPTRAAHEKKDPIVTRKTAQEKKKTHNRNTAKQLNLIDIENVKYSNNMRIKIKCTKSAKDSNEVDTSTSEFKSAKNEDTKEPNKPKKVPRIKVVGNGPPIPQNWADHEDFFKRQNLIKIKPQSFHLNGPQDSDAALKDDVCDDPPSDSDTVMDSDTIHNDNKHDEMVLDTEKEVDDIAMGSISIAPDKIYNLVSKWGKGTECEIEWGFRQSDSTYRSKGTVVGRSSRKGVVKIKISYEPLKDNGPRGVLYLPQSNKIRI